MLLIKKDLVLYEKEMLVGITPTSISTSILVDLTFTIWFSFRISYHGRRKEIFYGQSIYAAMVDHSEITQCEKAIYNYTNQGVFSVNGLINLDLRLKPSRKPMKTVKPKVRKDLAYLKGRTYKCFTEYMDLHPYSSVVEPVTE